MIDQVTNGSLEIALVVEMRGDAQTHIFADPYEIPVNFGWPAQLNV